MIATLCHDPARARRLGEQDFFSQYAAQGRRNGSARVHLSLVSDADRTQNSCPAALLVGLDTTPEPGLRGPTNFHGVADAALLHDLDKNLGLLRASLR